MASIWPAEVEARRADHTSRYGRLECPFTPARIGSGRTTSIPVRPHNIATPPACSGAQARLESPAMAAQNWDRRTFIEALGGVTAGALVAPRDRAAPRRRRAPAAAIGPRPPAPAWCDEPMRWAQLTLVENDPGQRRPRLLARLLPPHPRRRRLPQRRRLRRLLPDRGPLPPPQRVARRPRPVRRAGRRLPQAAAWSSSRAPTRTRRTTTPRARIPTGSPSTPTASRAGTGPRPSCGSPARSGPYNFEFMTAVHREIVSRYKVDGIFINRWAGQPSATASTAGRTSAPPPASSCRARRPAGPGAPRLHRLAQGPALRALAALGRRDPQDAARRVLHPERRRRHAAPPT